MRVLIVNPIIYTNETREIKKVNTIKDTMIYDLCLGFIDKGIDVTLGASDLYKPTQDEDYPFEVKWLKTKCTSLFPPHNLPYCPEVKKIAKEGSYDLIISSEVFSLNSLMLSIHSKNNLVVWQELGKHNKIFKGLASKFWYGVIARIFFKDTIVIPRSHQAKLFISKYCNKTTDEVIDHGVNLDKFEFCEDKENSFSIVSQLIPRKRIDKSIEAFSNYLEKYDKNAKLYIMGDGELKSQLEARVKDDQKENIIFTGKLPHEELIDILKKSKALLIYTESDLNMVSSVEALAVATPIITNTVPYCSYIVKNNELGIVNDSWNEDDLKEISENKKYINNCLNYREQLSTLSKVEQFISIKEKYIK